MASKNRISEDFVIVQDFKSPYVVSTGYAHKPTEIKAWHFKKGQVIRGEIKTANGKPSFVLYKGTIVVPLAMLKKVVTKEIVVSNASGDDHKAAATEKKMTVQKTKKTRYIDAAIFGAIAGFGTVYLLEKKGYLKTIEMKNKLIGMGIGAALAAYITFRVKKETVVKTVA